MAVEFTVWSVPKGTDAADMPFKGLEEANSVFDERRPGVEFYLLIRKVRELTNCFDDYVKVPEEHYGLLTEYVQYFDPAKDYVLSCV